MKEPINTKDNRNISEIYSVMYNHKVESIVEANMSLLRPIERTETSPFEYVSVSITNATNPAANTPKYFAPVTRYNEVGELQMIDAETERSVGEKIIITIRRMRNDSAAVTISFHNEQTGESKNAYVFNVPKEWIKIRTDIVKSKTVDILDITKIEQ